MNLRRSGGAPRIAHLVQLRGNESQLEIVCFRGLRNIAITHIDRWSPLFSCFVLQIMDRSRQLSESARLDGIFSILETSDGAFGNSGLAREKPRGKLFCCCPNLVQIFSRRLLFRTREMFGASGPGLPLRSWLNPEEDKKLIEEINLLADAPDLQTHDEHDIDLRVVA